MKTLKQHIAEGYKQGKYGAGKYVGKLIVRILFGKDEEEV